jgi:hypothetical protein
VSRVVDVTAEPSPSSLRVFAPFDADTVGALERYQHDGGFHPYTCPASEKHGSVRLVPFSDGWHCVRCDYTQRFVSASAVALVRLLDRSPWNEAAKNPDAAEGIALDEYWRHAVYSGRLCVGGGDDTDRCCVCKENQTAWLEGNFDIWICSPRCLFAADLLWLGAPIVPGGIF